VPLDILDPEELRHLDILDFVVLRRLDIFDQWVLLLPDSLLLLLAVLGNQTFF